jgi:hypothetical protein
MAIKWDDDIDDNLDLSTPGVRSSLATALQQVDGPVTGNRGSLTTCVDKCT